jgi:hypothetical protein
MDGTLLSTVNDGTRTPILSQAVSDRTARALRAAEAAGICVVVATGRRAAYTTPLLDGIGLKPGTPLITSNGAVTRTLGGTSIDRCNLEARVARGLCGLLRPYGTLVFTFARDGRGELVLEDLDHVHQRIDVWVEANRHAIEVVQPLELALSDGEDPIQGMVAGAIDRLRQAESALKSSEWNTFCESARTEYPARDLSILDLLPPGVSKGWALQRLAARLGINQRETMAIGDNWNDLGMLEWAAQGVIMANAASDLRALAKLRGWKQAPSNDDDGVAVILEKLVEKQGRIVAS